MIYASNIVQSLFYPCYKTEKIINIKILRK